MNATSTEFGNTKTCSYTLNSILNMKNETKDIFPTGRSKIK